MMRAVTSLPEPVDAEETTPAKVVSKDGASAEVREVEGGERLRITDREGAMLLEYDPATGRAVLNVPAGNLVLSAPRGDVDIVAGGRVRLHGDREVALSGARGAFAFGEATLSSMRASLNVESARAVFGRVETVATEIVQRAKNVFRRVEEVDDLSAGRQRSVIRGSYSLRSERVTMRAEDDVKIDGERIRLG